MKAPMRTNRRSTCSRWSSRALAWRRHMPSMAGRQAMSDWARRSLGSSSARRAPRGNQLRKLATTAQSLTANIMAAWRSIGRPNHQSAATSGVEAWPGRSAESCSLDPPLPPTPPLTSQGSSKKYMPTGTQRPRPKRCRVSIWECSSSNTMCPSACSSLLVTCGASLRKCPFLKAPEVAARRPRTESGASPQADASDEAFVRRSPRIVRAATLSSREAATSTTSKPRGGILRPVLARRQASHPSRARSRDPRGRT
mmetsp:Transcript_112032/g.356058  ORF Transcript_112032/g.356058 Transcript_112032/m.356058 type:complete len:255 (+) Transcript_112032:3722-4486(+)